VLGGVKAALASMRRPPGIKLLFKGHVHGRAKYRSAALPFALIEGPPKGARCRLGSDPVGS
jgi:hypothetical protein